MVLLLWGGAFGVDIGLTVVGGRQTQAISDTAALDMARYINIADWTTTLNSQILTTSYLNGKLAYADSDNSSNATLTETPGVWQNGTFTPRVRRSGPTRSIAITTTRRGPTSATRSRSSASQSVPQIFVGGHSSVTRTSIAAVTPEAGFSVGSYLATVDSQQSTVLNALLGTLGGSATVTAVGYEGLANTYVSINQLITASGGLLTTSNVMTTSLLGSQWLAIWSNAVANQVAQLNCGATPTPFPCSASTALSALGSTASTSAELCQLVSINGSTCSSGNLSTAALSTSLNVLQSLTTEAEVANGTNAIDLGSSLGLPLVTDAQLTLGSTAGQVPQVAYGPAGTTASTAQISTDLKLTVLGVSGVVDIPLTGAQATATLLGVTCANNALKTANIQPAATTATGTVTVGGVSLSTLSVSGYSGSQFGYGPSVVPPTASTAAADSNPIVAGSNSPALSYSPAISASSPVYGLLTSNLPPVLGPILQAVGTSVGGAVRGRSQHQLRRSLAGAMSTTLTFVAGTMLGIAVGSALVPLTQRGIGRLGGSRRSGGLGRSAVGDRAPAGHLASVGRSRRCVGPVTGLRDTPGRLVAQCAAALVAAHGAHSARLLRSHSSALAQDPRLRTERRGRRQRGAGRAVHQRVGPAVDGGPRRRDRLRPLLLHQRHEPSLDGLR